MRLFVDVKHASLMQKAVNYKPYRFIVLATDGRQAIEIIVHT
jgi:hypothetical protein